MRDSMPTLVALGGLKGSGKSTAAESLICNGFVRVKMAGALKAMLDTLMKYQGASPVALENYIEGDLKEHGCPYLAGRTPRHAMQTLGAEWGRDLIAQDFWVSVAKEAIVHNMNAGLSIVVDDVRYPNELEMIRSLGGVTVWIARPGVYQSLAHSSEKSISAADFTLTVVNDGAERDLRRSILSTLTEWSTPR